MLDIYACMKEIIEKLAICVGNAYMLFAGWEVRIVKNCDRGQDFQVRGHSFHYMDQP